MNVFPIEAHNGNFEWQNYVFARSGKEVRKHEDCKFGGAQTSAEPWGWEDT